MTNKKSILCVFLWIFLSFSLISCAEKMKITYDHSSPLQQYKLDKTDPGLKEVSSYNKYVLSIWYEYLFDEELEVNKIELESPKLINDKLNIENIFKFKSKI